MDRKATPNIAQNALAAYHIHSTRRILAIVLGRPQFTQRIGAECIKEYAAKHGINPGLFQVVHTFGRDGKKNVYLQLSVTCGGLTANNTQWKNLKFTHFILMKAWRKAVTNLIWQAYKTGRLSLPDDKPTLNAIRAWLKEHYQKIWHVHLAKPTNSHKKTSIIWGATSNVPLSRNHVSFMKMRAKSFLSILTIMTKKQNESI